MLFVQSVPNPFQLKHYYLIIKKLLGLNQSLGVTSEPLWVPEWVKACSGRSTIVDVNGDSACDGFHGNNVDKKCQGAVKMEHNNNKMQQSYKNCC